MQSSILFVCMCFSSLSFFLSVLYYFCFFVCLCALYFFVCYHILWWIKITVIRGSIFNSVLLFKMTLGRADSCSLIKDVPLDDGDDDDDDDDDNDDYDVVCW